MPFFATLFKRIFRYMLNRYFGQYIVDFSQKDLTYSLSYGSVENIQLNVEALNELSEEYNFPLEFLHGSIENVSIAVPWRTLLCENTIIEVCGLKVVVQPKQRPQDASVFDSMWGSMTSSLQLVEECLNSNDDDDELDVPDQAEGLEKIASAIDAVLANIKIRFQDSSVKIEHVLPIKSTGISLEVKVASAEYFDEAGVNAPSGHAHESDKNSYEPSAYSFKRVIFEGVSLYTAEFLPEEREFSNVQQVFSSEGVDSSHFVPGSPEMPPPHSTLPMKKNEPNFSCDPVLISKLNGQQELGLKLKQNEAVIGPKVDVEFNLGAFNLFLTPQQVHLLFILMNGLMKPNDTSCDTSKKVQSTVANKPMRPADYMLVEQELMRQQERSGVMSRSLKNQQGWSSHSLDESDEDFHLMTMENKAPSEIAPSISSQDDLLSSSLNSDTRSDCVGIFPFNQRTKSKGSVEAILTDPLSELTHFHGCLSSLLIIILHDDSVQETCTGVSRSDCVSLKVQAETFFSDLLDLQMSGFNFKDFLSARDPLSKLCETNHLRMMASGIILDGNEESSSVERIMKFNVSFHQAEILECLFNSPLSSEPQNPKYMQLLSFEKQNASSVEHKEACFKLKYSQTECTSQNRTYKPPANKLDIELGTVLCDVDISLTDRIRTLLNFSNAVDNIENKWDNWKDSDVGMVTQTSSKTEISVTSPFVTVNLRFPIPDLRSVHDMDRAPWWQQNIHKEVLILELQEVSFKTTLDDDELFKKYEIQCQDIHGLFKVPNLEDPISFLRVSVDPDADEDSRKSGFDWPRLVIRRMTKVVSPDLECALKETDELFSCSLSYALMTNLASEPSPFCTTSVVHDSSEANANLSSDHNEVIKPADKDGLLNFVEQTVNKSECVFEFTLPAVNLVFPDKDIFELLYNRLGNDLLLWTNTSLTTTNTYDSAGFKVHIPGFDVSYSKGQAYEQFPVFKPFNNDCLLDSDSEEEEALHMSVHEYYQRQKQKHKKSNEASVTKISLSFSITKGNLLVNTPLLDDANELVHDHCGKLQLSVEECVIFLASSYQGDPNESYMCLVSEKSALYHEGVAQLENKHPVVPPLSGHKNNNLRCIIYESDPGMHLIKSLNSCKEMLKFAVHIVRSPKQQIKTIKVAIEISSATLRHYVLPSSQMWISQLINFLKVNEFPVNGYTPPAVVTELHLNLSNCAVDYRPFRLPYWTALTVENFNMSCNVTATTPSFLFRVISEELRLFISSKIEANKIDLRKNYVCVIDTGLIDISIKTSVDEKENPRVEMSVSNNKVHIRTCSDSCKALLDLILYLSTNGDMETKVNDQEENENKSFMKSKSFDSDSQNLDILMAEAMKECSLNGNNEKFPKNTNFDYSATDDEFCILEDDPGVGLIPKNGEPQIRMLTDEPIKIIENHFSVPPGKSDVLKAPKHFPSPLFQVTLQEMCLIWHLYGGYDFKNTQSDSKKKHKNANADNIHRNKHTVTFSDQGNIDAASVGFYKVTPMPKSFDSSIVQFSMEHVTINDNQRSSSPESWLHIGGSGRNHDVLMELQMTKVQFQREIYPLDSAYSSRYILLIHDIELRDRLAVSQINVFLYQYATKDLPRQSHANMIDIKAVYTRPDLKRSTEECSLKVSCKPLRLNVDQDALMFLVEFFQDLLGVPVPESSEGSDGEVHDEKVVPSRCNFSANINTSPKASPVNETFYRFFSFSPDVLIKIDYHGKRVLMEKGAVRGLVMGLAQLNASEIRLKRLCYRHGLLGHHKLVSYALNEWQQDILKNQLPSLLGGVGPMHSFVQLFQGVKDLFYLPVAQYRKDGQIVRGLQRGASSFSTSTVIALLDLSSRFFYAVQFMSPFKQFRLLLLFYNNFGISTGVCQGLHQFLSVMGTIDELTQGTAEVAYDMVSPGPRLCGKSVETYRKNSQPADIIEGVSTACIVVKEGLKDTARTIYRVASTEHEHKGVPGAVGGVLRQIPPSLFKPIILGSEATSYVLDGVRHQLMPDAHQEDIHKWRTKN